MTLDPDEVYDPFTITNTFELDLEKIERQPGLILAGCQGNQSLWWQAPPFGG